jgi:hypothetical protein
VGERALNVELREAMIERYRRGIALDALGDRLGEAT